MDNRLESARSFDTRRLRNLETAHAIARKIASMADLESALRFFVDSIADILSVEIVSLMLADLNNNWLIIRVARGLNDALVKNARIKLGEKSVAGYVYNTGESVLVKDITADNRFEKRSGNTYHNNSLLSVPLKSRGQVIGVLNVNNKNNKKLFDDYDLFLLQTITETAASAIDGMRLYEAVARFGKARVDFASNVTHELRSPLSIVKEAVSLMSDSTIVEASGGRQKFLEIARKNIERMNNLIDGILELGREEERALRLHRVLFDISALARSVSSSLAVVAEKSGVKIIFSATVGKIEIWGDESRIEEVITNIIDNAVKYNRKGGNVKIALEDNGQNITVRISDTGQGMSQETLSKIFDRYYRALGQMKSGAKGTGLGLALAKGIVEAHGGEIMVFSEEGKGSEFVVTLPKDPRRSKRNMA